MASNPAELLAGLRDEVAAETAEEVDEHLVVPIEYRLGNGKVLEGNAVFHVPLVGEQVQIGILEAKLRRNVPISALDPYVVGLVRIQAFIEVCYSERPAWLRDTNRVLDPKLLERLYEEGQRHMARFLDAGRDLRPRPPPPDGADGDGEAAMGSEMGAAEPR